MPTSLGDLLYVLGDEATRRAAAVDPVDADRALARLGRTLGRLALDRVSTSGETDRDWWVGELSRSSACAAADVSTADPGRLAQLAGAVDDLVALMRESLSSAQRWAIATTVVGTVRRLPALAERGDITNERRRALIVVDASATVVRRISAIEPPSAVDWVPLDWAVPQPVLDPAAAPALIVTEAIAGLEHETRSAAGRMPIADYLAVCTALESLSRSVADPNRGGDLRLAEAAHDAGQGWAAARAVLNPFDDGSRRPHSVAPPAVAHAVRLHAALGRLSASPIEGAVPMAAVSESLQRVPTVAEYLRGALTGWATERSALGYARDLERRESRITRHLAGYHSRGLLRPDADDFAPARAALSGARLLSVELASRAALPAHSRSNVARLAVANRSERAALTDHRIHSAAIEARNALRIYAGPPRGGQGPRR